MVSEGWEDRFWAKVEENDGGCWLWTASLTTGCGQFGRATGKGRGETTLAHRIAYELVVGVIPAGLTLDHLCRNRRCVNPAHLEPVTNRENILRGNGWAGQNARKTHCPQGHPYAGDNLIVHRDGDRRCRTCANTWHRPGRAHA